MLPVDLSLLDLVPVHPGETPVGFVHEKWIAAGKPRLCQNCGHSRSDHIPSEAMEYDRCDCLRFVGFTP